MSIFAGAGSPIPYESLRSYFQSDPASSWGAYVTGCLLVLAHEKRVTFPDGISILVASDVPEGGKKGCFMTLVETVHLACLID